MVAESALNVSCVGATPVAVVNCLNFGNPEHPEVMWQLSEAIDGMSQACLALGLPVIGGNVSLYNESRGRDIDPTPVVGTLGLVDHLEAAPPGPVLSRGSRIVLVGAVEGGVSLAGSKWAVERRGHRGGRLPSVDFELHARLLALVAGVAGTSGLVEGIHDVSEGGLGVALTEMAVRSGVGCRVSGVPDHDALFGEGPSRVLLCVPERSLERVLDLAGSARVPARVLGEAGGDRIVYEGLADIGLAEATAAWKGALPLALTGTAG